MTHRPSLLSFASIFYCAVPDELMHADLIAIRSGLQQLATQYEHD